MGTGWRRAFCTTLVSDKKHKNGGSDSSSSSSPNPSPKCTKLSLFNTRSNPSTPRLDSKSQCILESKLTCKTKAGTTITSSSNNNADQSPKLKHRASSSTPSSPQSPLKLSLLKNNFKFRNSCGICSNSARTRQGTAIYTAECGHTFHFPCIAAHVRLPGNNLSCPVCNTPWKDVPILTGYAKVSSRQDTVVQEKILMGLSPRGLKPDREELKSPRVGGDFRCYDDDEPLLSPTTGVRFVPIPEVDENVGEDDEDEDEDEFRGFFVNQNDSSCYEEQQINVKKAVDVRILPECSVISASRSHETRAVAIRVKAPRLNKDAGGCCSVLYPAGRAPVDLVAILDVSGNMSGAKLQMLKRAMRLVIASLGSTDRLAIVAFSAVSKRLSPLRRMTAQGQRAARKIVDRLGCARGSGTCVGEALTKASKVLEDRRERNPVASVVLFSDGQDERAIASDVSQRRGLSHVSSTRFAHIEIPVHASGFGKKIGFSNEPAEDAFGRCIGGLLSVVAQDMRLQLRFASGSAPADITAVYSYGGRPTLLGSESVRLGDFYGEEERELLVELRVPASAMGSRSHHVLSVRCSYRDPASQEVIHGQDQRLVVPAPVQPSVPKIKRFRSLFIASRAIAESRRLVDHDDYTSAHHLLGSARVLLMQSGSGIAEEYVKALESELSGVNWKRQQRIEEGKLIQRQRLKEREMVLMSLVDDNGEPLTPTSAWRAAEKLAKVAMMKSSLSRIGDLHGFENARF